MRKPKNELREIFFYSHPSDKTIRYVGSERFGQEPPWLLNNHWFKEWIGNSKVDINIIDVVLHDDVEFWTDFYRDLFTQWGFDLIGNNLLKEAATKRVRDLHKIKNLIVNSLYKDGSDTTRTSLQDFHEFFHKFEKLNAETRDSFLKETALLIHCLFIDAIPWKECLNLSPSRVRKGYIVVGNTILTFSERVKEYSRLNCTSSETRIFQEVPKVCHKSQLEIFFIRYLNALSIYFGYSPLTKGDFMNDFGRLKYWKSGTAYSTTIFLIRLFKCRDRLELLVKLDLIPHLR